ncbi:hypothetical protein [Longirhabdus pacifica]|uniref:hypothetical protein n=1 Tax=Longirhabdus pacifica TaxID=2305227 RepID=UPI0010092D80|nr:hypothetical protein [Longirhabdus pacifica]
MSGFISFKNNTSNTTFRLIATYTSRSGNGKLKNKVMLIKPHSTIKMKIKAAAIELVVSSKKGCFTMPTSSFNVIDKVKVTTPVVVNYVAAKSCRNRRTYLTTKIRKKAS